MLSDQEYLQNAGVQDTAATTPTSDTPTTEAPAQAPTPTEMFELAGNKYPVTSEFQVNHGGKVLKVPYNSLVNTYRQSAHMQDKWAEFKKLQQDHQTKIQDYDKFKTFHDKYGQLQDWSEKNPDQWATLWDLYQNKDKHLLSQQVQSPAGAPQGQNPYNLDPLVNEITQLKSQLGKYDQMLQKMEATEREASEAKDVDFVKTEVQTFGKEFPEIDIAEVDPDGVPLWAKIANWGHANGYHEFTPAAHMFLKQRIADTYQTRARAEAMKSVKQEHINGVVRRSATPMQGQGQTRTNTKKLSYAELAELAKNGNFATGT